MNRRFLALFLLLTLTLTSLAGCSKKPPEDEMGAVEEIVENGPSENTGNGEEPNDSKAPADPRDPADNTEPVDPKDPEDTKEPEDTKGPDENTVPDKTPEKEQPGEPDKKEPELSGGAKLKKELTAAKEVTASFEEEPWLIPTPELDFHTWSQGGWTDGRYYYQCFVWRHDDSNQQDNKVVVVKYDLQEKQVVCQSEILALNHANDMTYDAKNHRLIVVNNKPNWRTLTFLDPDTLEIVGTQQLQDQIFGMDYLPARDQYAIGVSSVYPTFRVLNGNFEREGPVYETVARTNEMVRQTIACNQDFIFHLYHLPNFIAVYDWEGNFVTLIDFWGRNMEPENMTVIGDTIYVACGDNQKAGARIFVLKDFVPNE